MSCNALGRKGRICREERSNDSSELVVLRILVRNLVRAFELDTDRVIVATGTPTVLGQARVPGPFTEWNVLGDESVTANENVG